MDRHLKIHMEELKGPQASVLNCQSKHVKGTIEEKENIIPPENGKVCGLRVLSISVWRKSSKGS